ncbi:chorismate lyase [Exilibacterium tricleocarpae]|uniref:Probable chorismate pyruvate-lyase n=1 Tax=Exilibacterium tricleocarpae TaxID=2591008 RepID=A0A545TZC2_9GAMM|nr:chorismate lyase [Exilibacterium tricleocarpae]TQV82568.1 chorismate lyase [Exilibacterium tricleocarpae]
MYVFSSSGSRHRPGPRKPGEPVWSARPGGNRRPAAHLRRWLLDRGSLTQHLICASQGRFAVQVLHQAIGCPRPGEARALGLGPRRRALIREVILYGRDQPWVFARSILPLSTLTGRQRALRRLDDRPLGALLFKDPSMRRGPIEMAPILPAHGILPLHLQHPQPAWGRRSVFYLDAKPLLVCEIFLATFGPTGHPMDNSAL